MLALQGDVREHVAALRESDAEAFPVRLAAELEGADALVIPGGESTTMGTLLRAFGLEQPLRERLDTGMPVLATCAGLILLSREVLDGRPDQLLLGTLDVGVRRNAYGRQVESFEADISVDPLGVAPFRGVFIRAPQIEHVGDDAEVIASLDEKPVAVRQGASIGLTFHPEMTDDRRIHQLFVRTVEAALAEGAA